MEHATEVPHLCLDHQNGQEHAQARCLGRSSLHMLSMTEQTGRFLWSVAPLGGLRSHREGRASACQVLQSASDSQANAGEQPTQTWLDS